MIMNFIPVGCVGGSRPKVYHSYHFSGQVLITLNKWVLFVCKDCGIGKSRGLRYTLYLYMVRSNSRESYGI